MTSDQVEPFESLDLADQTTPFLLRPLSPRSADAARAPPLTHLLELGRSEGLWGRVQVSVYDLG